MPDQAKLRKAYLKISRENHPDFSAGDEELYETSLQKTSENNEAYNTLSDFEARLKYVLQLKGYALQQDDKLDHGFLMEMMEWNERIMDVGMMEDAGEIKRLTEDFEALRSTYETKLKARIEAYEASGEEAELKAIKEIYLQRKYLLRLNESIDKFAAL